MKANSILLAIILVVVGCKRNTKNIEGVLITDDSISLYIKKIDSDSTDIEKKIKLNDKLFELFKSDNVNKYGNNLLEVVSENYYKFYQDVKLKESGLLLLEKALIKNDSTQIANAYNLLGRYYSDIQKNDSSFYYFLKAEKLYLRKRDTLNLSKIYLQKAKIQLDENNFVTSLNNSFLALKYLKSTNLTKELYNCYILIGDASDEISEYDNSINYYTKALEILKKSNSKNIFNENLHLESSVNNNIGFVYKNMNNHKKAIEYFEAALDSENLLNDSPKLYAMALDNLAYSKLKTNDYTNLPDFFNKSLKIREENNISTGVILNKIHLSEYYHSQKDTLKAKRYSLEALNQAKKEKLPGDILISLKQSSIVDQENASEYSQEYIKLSDSLQLEDRKNKDRFARIELETDELRQENTQLSEQNRDILNYFAIAIVFGGFLFFARFQRLRARELALKQTQQQANEEIYRLIISHQNQLEEGRDLEKRRISKELHDGVLGRLFGLRLNLDGLNNFDDEETKQQRLDYLNELKIIEQDLREISHELSRENLVLINNFVAIINNLLEQQSKINNARINTLISDKIDWEKVSNTIKINLYRILQESLQNINKHAEAKNINIIFNKDPKGNLIFSVEDDGKGYNTNGKKTKGIGVNNIVERVHQCQGKIDIKSQIGKGTKIIITFPLENETINM